MAICKRGISLHSNKNYSTSLILYLVAPVEAINLILVRNYFSDRTPNSKRRNYKVVVFSKRRFLTYPVIAEGPSIMHVRSKSVYDQVVWAGTYCNASLTEELNQQKRLPWHHHTIDNYLLQSNFEVAKCFF